MSKEIIKNEPGGAEILEQNFDTTGLLLDYVSNWKWFVTCLIIAIVIALCNIKTIVPTYQVGAAVYLNDDNTTKTNAVTMGSDNPLVDLKSMIDETEIEILKSRNSVIQIVDSLNLSYSYFKVGSWRNEPQYKTNPIVASMEKTDLWNLKGKLALEIEKQSNKYIVHVNRESENATKAEVLKFPVTINTPSGPVTLAANGESFKNFNGTYLINIVNPNVAAGQVAGRMSIQFAENAPTILNFHYVTPLPELGDDILQTMIYFYNKQIIEDKNRSAIQTEAFILDRLVMISDELRDVENRLRDYRQSHNIVNLDAQVNMNLSQQTSSESEIRDLESKERILTDMQSQAQALDISSDRLEISTLAPISPNQALNSSIEKFNAEVQRYNAQRRSMTEAQEFITNMISRLQEQRNQIIKNISAARTQMADQRRNIASVGSRSTSQLAAQPSIDKGLQEIFREQSVKVNIYTFLLQKREEIALQKTLATPTAQFIDNPQLIRQVAPDSTRIILFAIILGLVIPAVVILLKRILFPKFKEKEDIERVTTVPIIGEICKTDLTDSEIVINENVSTPVAELFRLLRNNIAFARSDSKKQVIMLTSAISGEGKTFVALNLAMTYALANKRVALVGLDIRRPVIVHKLGLSNRVGITSYLSGQITDEKDILFQSSINPNLYIIPGGPIPPNPNELLMSENMDKLIAKLRQDFDYIIIDSAPIGLVSDSLLIAPHTDLQLYVTRASYSTQKGLKVLHEAIGNGQLPKAYIVLNGVDTKRRTYNYRRYGNYWSSGSSYGSGYHKKKKRSLLDKLLGRNK